MTIRVAYDISVLGRSFQHPAHQSGVYRTIEELLFALSERSDIDLTAVGICGDDLLIDALYAGLYIENEPPEQRLSFDPAFKSRFGLEQLYRNFLGSALSDRDGSRPAWWRRKVGGLLYRLHYTYGIDEISPAFDSERYDLFHSTFLPLPAKEAVPDLPRVLTIYDLIFINKPEFGTEGLRRLLTRILASINFERDWVACISEFTKQELCAHTGMDPERVAVTPLAAADWFQPVQNWDLITEARQRYGIPNEAYFLTVATLQPRKNLRHVIESFFKFAAEYPAMPANLVLAGAPSWEHETTIKSAKSSNLFSSRVIFTGHVANADLSAIYSGAAAFVFPSLYEGFGLPALEAMQCGTPVIASNTTALPEVVGDAGLLIDPTDSDALCQAMLTVFEDQATRQQLRQRALERAKQFTWGNCAAQTVALYTKALEQGG